MAKAHARMTCGDAAELAALGGIIAFLRSRRLEESVLRHVNEDEAFFGFPKSASLREAAEAFLRRELAAQAKSGLTQRDHMDAFLARKARACVWFYRLDMTTPAAEAFCEAVSSLAVTRTTCPTNLDELAIVAERAASEREKRRAKWLKRRALTSPRGEGIFFREARQPRLRATR